VGLTSKQEFRPLPCDMTGTRNPKAPSFDPPVVASLAVGSVPAPLAPVIETPALAVGCLVRIKGLPPYDPGKLLSIGRTWAWVKWGCCIVRLPINRLDLSY
jgi:hypothetical protein